MIPITRVVIDQRARALVEEVLSSGQLAQGPMVARLEELIADIVGVEHAIAVTSGTSALIGSLRALDIGQGDEVITSPFTFAATLNAILEVGATARFADIGADYNLRPDAIEALINDQTAAILPVHLYGLMAEMTHIASIADRRGLRLVEDAAQAIGAEYDERQAGSFGVGCFSMYATKNVATGEGGVITTDDARLASHLRVLRNQGMRKRYDYVMLGQNLRMTDLQAAVGIPQLENLDAITELRRKNAAWLSAELDQVGGLVLPKEPDGRKHVYHQYTVRITTDSPIDRDSWVSELSRRGIGTGVYYPRPVFDYPVYLEHPLVSHRDEVPNAFEIARQVFSLPVHSSLTEAELEKIAHQVRSVARSLPPSFSR